MLSKEINSKRSSYTVHHIHHHFPQWLNVLIAVVLGLVIIGGVKMFFGGEIRKSGMSSMTIREQDCQSCLINNAYGQNANPLCRDKCFLRGLLTPDNKVNIDLKRLLSEEHPCRSCLWGTLPGRDCDKRCAPFLPKPKFCDNLAKQEPMTQSQVETCKENEEGAKEAVKNRGAFNILDLFRKFRN